MRGCGTVFNEDNSVGLTEQEIETLNQLERLALKHEYSARQLRGFCVKCRQQQTMEGLAEMVAFSFNAHQYQPNYGGGGGEQLPPGKYKGVIVNAEPVNTKDQAGNVKGGYLALTIMPTEGPLAGQKHTDRLNLHHINPKVVEIANEQMSAYCHVLGQFAIQDTMQLCNIPFCFEIGYQKGQEPTPEKPNGGFTEVKAIFDANGNPPGKAGSGAAPVAAQPAPATAPPTDVAPAAQPPAAWGQPAPTAEAPPAAQPGWGAPAAEAAPAAAPAPAVAPPPWGGPTA